jgi:hypothetical protein
MEQTYTSWAMVLIGTAATVAGIVGYVLPEGRRLSVALALLVGAGVGVTTLFLQALGGAFDDPENAARAFLIASVLGFVCVTAGLVVLYRRGRAR